jgi:hypothetical protein
MIFGRVMALGLWNLAKYLVVTTFFHYDLRYWLDFWYVNLRRLEDTDLKQYFVILSLQLNIWPNFKVQGPQLNQKSLDRNEMYTWSVTRHYTLINQKSSLQV